MMWALLSLLSACVLYQCGFFLGRKRLLDREWEEVLCCLSPVDREAQRQIDVLATLEWLEATPQVDLRIMWINIGGIRGLWKLKRNVDCMLDLAVYAGQWDDELGAVFADLMRLDALRMRQAICHLLISYLTTRSQSVLLKRLQQVARSYDSARVRTIGIYRRQHAGRLPKVEFLLFCNPSM